MGKTWYTTVLLAAILLLGLALRLMPWDQNRFLEDEALYAYWGLQIANGVDSLLDEEPVDKPPLYLYILALSFSLFPSSTGVTAGGLGHETAARFPSLLASVTSIALVYGLGLVLYRNSKIGLLAALLLVLSSFDILFASTAFTDPLMTVLALGSLLSMAKGRLGTAGLLSGLAAATKQQGLFFLPLVVIVGFWGPTKQRNWRTWLRFVIGLAIVAGGTIWWDLARGQRPGFFEQSLISYGGLALVQPQALGQRAVEWLQLVGMFWISPWFNMSMIGALALWLAGRCFVPGTPSPRTVDWLLLMFIAGYLLLHWLVGFQVWDRYLLGLVPLMAILAARAFVTLGETIRVTSWRLAYIIGLGLVLAASLARPVSQATQSQVPLGGDHGAYDGIDDLAAYIRTQASPDAVLYHYWLGYHYRFYLYGVPVRLHWYPDLEDLARDAHIYRREPRYIAFPSWQDSTPAEETLAGIGIRLVPLLETTRRDGSISLRLYHLEGP
jgi:4-amino-4-deoxy-L-arabinose transferase-like glycosyltransferase